MPICSHCGSENVIKRGYSKSGKVKIQCKEEVCKENPYSLSNPDDVEPEASYEFTSNGDTAQINAEIYTDDEIQTVDDLIRHLKIDTTMWKIDKFQVGKSVAYRKDRKVQWTVVDGKVVSGEVDDSGKLLLKPIFNVKVWMSRKTEEIRATLALEDFKTTAYQFAPKALKLKLPAPTKGMLYEVEMPDLHIGKLTWGEETGEDTDIKIQVEQAKGVMEKLLSHASLYPIERILFPIGHDYYNVDNQYNTTSHGTPQQEDTRWRKTFKVGWSLAAELINMCATIAPVDVLIVSGNHDEERSYYLGEVLSALYANTDRVVVDNSPKKRKYYGYGNVLLGLTHGYHEKLKELKDLMAYEVPQMWANSLYREWHTGDKHHKEDYVHKTHEANNGVVIRVLRSLSPADLWHFDKGYVGSLKASEAFLWDKECGLVGQFPVIP